MTVAGAHMHPMHLYIRGMPELAGRTLGRLTLTSIGGPTAGEWGLRLSAEYHPPVDDIGSRRLVEVGAAITSVWPTHRTYGRVRMLSNQPGRLGLLSPAPEPLTFVWSLAADEIELVETERAAAAKAQSLTFNLDLSGIAVLADRTVGFEGTSQFSLSSADWLALLGALGYGTPPSLAGLVETAMTDGVSWRVAEDKLRPARRQLGMGEDREALRSAYLLLDAISPNPYKSDWQEALEDPDMPPGKAAAIRGLLRAESHLLSALGRHPSWERSESGDREMLPLDHWEAELAVAVAQLLLAAAERWRTIKAAHELERQSRVAS